MICSPSSMLGFLNVVVGDWLIYALAAASILLAILLLLAVVWIVSTQHKESSKKKAAEKEDKADATPAEHAGQASAGLAPAFMNAMGQLRHRVSGPDYRYRVPWYLMIGPSESGKTTLLTDSHLRLLLEEDGRGFAGDQSIGWKFYGDGIVLDTAGAWSMGSTGHESANWKRLLRLLNRHRPRRPLDGIGIAVSCADMIGPAAMDQVALLRSAALLHDRLRQVQQILGFRLPVYFVITKCDYVPGFRSFSQELPPERLRDIFGWSSPYNLDTAFDPSWVDEAFVEIRSTIEQTQNEIFAQRAYTDARQEMFLFPGELQSLYAPLRAFLSRAFRSSAYRESLYFRGIYFTGEFTEDTPAQTVPTASYPAQQPALSWGAPETSIIQPIFESWNGPEVRIGYVYDLFVKKIFVERGIAHPIASFFYTRNRTTIALQVVAVLTAIVLLVGTVWSYNRLEQAKGNVVPLLQHIVRDLGTTSVDASGQMQTASDPADAGDLLQAMANLNSSRFNSFFMPASWTNPMDSSIRSAMVPAFRVLVLESFNHGLEQRAAEVTNPTLRPLPDVPAQSEADAALNFDVQALPEYQQLRAYNDQVQLLEENIALYESIRQRGGTAGLTAVLGLENYISGKKITLDMNQPQNPYFEQALQQATWAPFVYQQKDIQRGSQKMEQLTAAFFSAWIERNPVLQSLQNLSDALARLNRKMSVTYEQLTALQQAFHATQQALQAPDLQWVAEDNFTLSGTMYAVTVAPLKTSQYYQPYLLQWIPYSGETSFNKLTDNIANQESSLTGPLSEIDGSRLALTDNAEKVHIALDNLMNLPFVSKGSAQKIQQSAGAGMMTEWNTPVLQEAIALPDEYNHYVQEDLQNAPANLRSTFERIANQRLAIAMEDEAAQAQSFLPSIVSSGGQPTRQEILPQIQSFQNSADALSQLLNTFQMLGMTQPHERLQRATTSQAAGLLLQLNQAFDAEQSYTIPATAYASWLGDTPPTVAVLGAQTPEQVQDYLSAQREKVRSYSNAAEPLVSFLQNEHAELSPASRRAWKRWEKIGVDLKYYDNKRPGNTIAQVETWVNTDMDKVSPASLCSANPGSDWSQQGGDYFLQAGSTIRLDLAQRCRTLITFNVTRDYAKIASTFNHELAGHFPFAPVSQAVLGAEADPQSIRDFYGLFDTYSDLIQHALQQNNSFGDSGQDAATFLQQMQNDRPLFAAILGKQEHARRPASDCPPTFRVNQAREVNGNQIIQWTLQVGQDTFTSGSPTRMGRWIYGQPVSLTLRWAKNSPTTPYLSRAKAGVDLSDRTLTFNFNDNWALLNMLATHRAPLTEFDELQDPNPFTLMFQSDEAPVGPQNSSKSSMPDARARVFLGITLHAPGQQAELRTANFPVKAPLLYRTLDSTQDSTQDSAPQAGGK